MASNKKGGVLKAGAGLAALAAAAAGAYYFYGSKDAAKHRRALKGWTVKARGEVMERLERAQDVSKEAYGEVVDQVMAKYRAAKEIRPAELAALARELKGHWKNIKKELGMGAAVKSPARSKSKARPAKKSARQ